MYKFEKRETECSYLIYIKLKFGIKNPKTDNGLLYILYLVSYFLALYCIFGIEKRYLICSKWHRIGLNLNLYSKFDIVFVGIKKDHISGLFLLNLYYYSAFFSLSQTNFHSRLISGLIPA